MQKSIILDQNFDIVRKKAYAIRHNYFDDMDKYLLNLEGSLLKKGLNVVWTKDKNSLTQTIDSLINDLSVRRISFDSVFSFENYLQNRVDVIPFDLLESSSDDLDLLVVDADFAVCENGSLVFLDKQSQCCFNKTKNIAVIVNIDQAIANQQDLSFFIALKYLSQEHNMPHDVKIIQDRLQYVLPSQLSYLSEQMITQEQMNITVILHLNDIEEILSSELLKESLYCIQCGRCLEVCPVAAANDNLSPIQLIKMNGLDKYNQTQHLFSHTTLCGACESVCPVNIPLVNLMLNEMQASNMSSSPSRTKQLYSLFSKRSKINKANKSFFRFFFVKRFFGQNKQLSRYFANQNTDFFNISFQPPHEDNPNELIKDSDFE